MAWCNYHNQKCNHCGDCNVKGNEESIYNGKSRKFFKKIEKEKYGNFIIKQDFLNKIKERFKENENE